mgnify:CR=1 FL=1
MLQFAQGFLKAPLRGLDDVGTAFLAGGSERRTSWHGRDFAPVSAFFGLVDDDTPPLVVNQFAHCLFPLLLGIIPQLGGG